MITEDFLKSYQYLYNHKRLTPAERAKMDPTNEKLGEEFSLLRQATHETAEDLMTLFQMDSVRSLCRTPLLIVDVMSHRIQEAYDKKQPSLLDQSIIRSVTYRGADIDKIGYVLGTPYMSIVKNAVMSRIIRMVARGESFLPFGRYSGSFEFGSQRGHFSIRFTDSVLTFGNIN